MTSIDLKADQPDRGGELPEGFEGASRFDPKGKVRAILDRIDLSDRFREVEQTQLTEILTLNEIRHDSDHLRKGFETLTEIANVYTDSGSISIGDACELFNCALLLGQENTKFLLVSFQ